MLPKNPTKRPKIKESTLRNRADAIARARCKEAGCCAAAGYDPYRKGFKCAGRLEWAHLKSRDFKSIRHHPLNAVALCWAHHHFFTLHPDLWTHWIEVTYPGRWEQLNDILRSNVKVKYADVLERLDDD